MRLFIFSGNNKNVVPGSPEVNHEITGADLSTATDYFYDYIEAYDFLEYSIHEKPLEVLTSKLSKTGKIVIQGSDVNQACRLLKNGDIDNDKLSEILCFGRIRANSVHSILTEMQEKYGFEILYSGIVGHYYTIEAKRK